MVQTFFEKPILNSPYQYPARHWELDSNGQPNDTILPERRKCSYITPVPKAKKSKSHGQAELAMEAVGGITVDGQTYDPRSIINEVRFVFDLSATPFFLAGSGYREGTLFPWVMSDFSLMDAIECGIVKLPRVPISDNSLHDTPKLRILWESLKEAKASLPKSGRSTAAASYDPLSLPPLLITALEALYGHYVKTFDSWKASGITRPPVFIVVCQNTAISELVYKYISGFEFPEKKDGTIPPPHLGQFPLFRNYDENGTRLAQPRSLLIDSEQLESGDALDPAFRKMFEPEIERFRKDLVQRTGNTEAGRKFSDSEILREHLEITFPRVQGYRTEQTGKRLLATFSDDHTFVLNPTVVGPSKTVISGIIGKTEELNVEHLRTERASTILFKLTTRLIEIHYRDENGELQLHLFGQLKRIVRQWLDNHLVCQGDCYPAQILMREMADKACGKIQSAILLGSQDEQHIIAILDPYNPSGSSSVAFNSSKPTWTTDPEKSHVNLVVTDSEWEAEFARVAEAHPAVLSYVKNQGLGLEVPYLKGASSHRYLPDFLLKIDDGHGEENPLNLIVEIKGFRSEDAQQKALTMHTYWIPGINHLATHGRWAFLEITQPFSMESDLSDHINAALDQIPTV